MNNKRNTIQRRLVLDAVQALKTHPSADEIYRFVLSGHPGISRGTVYRNLHLLAEEGDILRIEVPNAADRFDFTVQPHYHIVCLVCGDVGDVDVPYLWDMNQKIHQAHGYEVVGHELIFKGFCPKCRAASTGERFRAAVCRDAGG